MSQFNKENSIEVSNLSVTYDLDGKSIQAVKNTSFNVPKETMIGIIGETGSGKSSLIRALNGLIKFPGIVNFDSLNILNEEGLESEFSFNKLRGKDVGFIPQNPFGSLNPVYKISKQFGFINKRHNI